jgi:hypothetical protein
MLAKRAPPVEGYGSRARSVRVAQRRRERVLRAASVPSGDVRGGYTGMAVIDRGRLEDLSQSQEIAVASDP